MRNRADALANILDDLSFRSSKSTQLAALQHIHTILADVCVGQSTEPRLWLNQLPLFLSLQDDFETNIASRILGSGIISASVVLRAVDEIRAKGASDRPPVSAVSDITALALSALQGMALIHPRSKTYMGRKLSIQTLLDLLTALRHASANPEDPDATVLPGVTTTDATLAASLSPLACSVIDTLLCLLVDSPAALRVFEECNGLEVIVRTLKKVIGQNVRMKCLEFLYFYLQDEEVLAITGTPIVNLPSTNSKSSASVPTSTLPVTTPAKPRTPQTPRRPRAHQVPATEARPRTRAPLARTVSQDSTHSVLSSRSRANSEATSIRSVSRASTASTSTIHSNATDSTTHSTAAEPERRFPRTLVMPSLSYSSSTVSSTSTNQTLDPHDPQSQSRPPTPGRKPSVSLSEECYVPLPESPTKPRRTDIEDTPRRAPRTRDETPRAKTRPRAGSENVPPPPSLPRLNLFPPPASVSPFGEKRTMTPVGLSMLTGEIDYTPESPRKPSRTGVGEDMSPARIELKPSPNPRETPSKPTHDPSPKPVLKSARSAAVGHHRPRSSEILPRPVLVKTGPRNVSSPMSTTPTTPSTPIGPTPPASTTTTPPVPAPSAPAVPAAATPSRAKRAVIPGGIRTPGRIGNSINNGDGEELRKSVGTEELRKSQAGEGLRKSQASREGLWKSQASSEGLRKSQAGAEGKDKTGEGSRLKKSILSTPIASRTGRVGGSTEAGRKAAEDGVRRAKEESGETKRKENVGAEAKGSIEMERKRSTESETRPGVDGENNRLCTSVAGNVSGEKVVRSSAEKKELLSAWLGNVDALVEGVQRAGVWGLR